MTQSEKIEKIIPILKKNFLNLPIEAAIYIALQIVEALDEVDLVEIKPK